jgi:type II restriction/modification system DNA methylase subunit YeeA
MSAKEILQSIINDFNISEFEQFFRQKNDKLHFPYKDLSVGNLDNFSDAKKIAEAQLENEEFIICSILVKKELTERSGKKSQYEIGKKILKQQQADAGIFIFYDSKGDFRFSLIYTNYLGKCRDWSTFKRFTYFVSKNQTNKTFLKQIGDSDLSSIEKIKEAFSVEKVTKEFFLEYRQLFDSLVGNLSKNHTFLNEASKNSINTENFAKKLLGQIVFLYFIQKKGWIGVPAGKKWGEGDKNFMSNIYKEAIAKKANFYNDYLEKLFYNALNNAYRDSAEPSFSKDFGSRIPFLNGGLFEAEYDWKNSLVYLDNKIFQSIFDVFERYNFTIEEESPDDKEIAVDPEMLGKIFENLLSENLRKGKGTYYTPREIVYYMCRESLVNYLVSNHSKITEENIRNYIFCSESFENFKKQKGESFTPGQWKELDDLLANIKVCDPACGSGAFLVGMLNMIVKLRIFLQTTPDNYLIPQKKEYELKRETIQNCIYGVDIDPGAIEIAKLRLWLTLVVDYNLEDIEPLPNLDYRLMCGNSLLEEFEEIKFYNDEKETQVTLLVDLEQEKKVEALRKKIKEYFSIHDDKEKLKKRKEINDIKDWLIGTALQKRYRDLALQKKEAESRANMLDEKSRKQYLSSFSKWLGSSSNIQKALEGLHNPKKEKPFFIWKLEFIDVFQEKGGFDIVIANPPYIRQEKIKDQKPILEKQNYEVFNSRADIYTYFYEKGYQLLKPEGILCFISSNKWLRAKYGEKLRKFLKEKTTIKQIIDFNGYKVFEATVDTNIILFQKTKPSNNIIYVLNIQPDFTPSTNIADYFKEHKLQIKQSDLDINCFTFGDELVLNLKKKIEQISTPLKNWDVKIYYGIKTGFNEAFIIDSAKREEILNNCQDDDERKRTEAIIKPILRGRDIYRYGYKWAGLWVIIVKYGFHTEIEKKYPAVLNHLTKYKNFLQNRGQCRYSRGGKNNIGQHHWLELDNNPRDNYLNEFEKEKIVWTGVGTQLETVVIPGGVYVNAPANFMTGKQIKYLQAVLNSNLVIWYYDLIKTKIGSKGGRFYIYDFLSLPIPKISESEQQPFIDLVDKILTITKDKDYLENPEKQAKVKEYEQKIDQLVYKLYNLTDEEIKIIEENE